MSQVLAKAVKGVPIRGMLLGAPGAGKGTQAQKIKNNFDVLSISSGDLLRRHIQNKSEVGLVAKKYVERGERYVHVPSGRIYNLTYNPPKTPGLDDITNEPLVHRPDDNADSLKTRLQKYHSATMPLLEYYDKKGVLKVFSGDSSDIIYPQIHSMLSDIFN
ncbi:GTP:AMP phosphotransferase, mitochondrial [Smittium culicis]|uniref:GTP:AMP phosphotransferase, mitochondrial n=1 Tax=Smittium culicis TaxID=133412 RepID=A0A1R1XDP4_9FUNG|nr:GTP:AMP phosphotransferase, mitochondrial [Smittium culicis]OMJ17326.1 GTP:AMP phosphotransferase, mitochondrial [Smittium culicis]